MTLNRRDFTLSSAAALGALAMNPTFAADTAVNRRWLLASRPVGKPSMDNFRLEEVKIPDIGDGQVLLQTLYLSLDPYMRGRMNAGKSYADRVELGDVMVGGTVSRVAKSRNGNFKEGELVSSYAGWQDYIVSNGMGLTKLDPRITRPSYALGVLGMPGLTAYVGLLDIGQPRPGDTVVLAASTGAVGSVVGQIAKLKGCRVIGIAGGKEKCDWLRDSCGADEVIDYKNEDVGQRLAQLCPMGINVFFDNVGGSILEAAIEQMADFGRIALCGGIAGYNDEEPAAGPNNLMILVQRRVRMQGFIVIDYMDRFDAVVPEIADWVTAGKLAWRVDMQQGFENIPATLRRLFTGENQGKQLLSLA